MIEYQLSRGIMKYSKCISYPPSLICNSYNEPFSSFKDLSNHDKSEGLLLLCKCCTQLINIKSKTYSLEVYAYNELKDMLFFGGFKTILLVACGGLLGL